MNVFKKIIVARILLTSFILKVIEIVVMQLSSQGKILFTATKRSLGKFVIELL